MSEDTRVMREVPISSRVDDGKLITIVCNKLSDGTESYVEVISDFIDPSSPPKVDDIKGFDVIDDLNRKIAYLQEQIDELNGK
jgi:hypothetical protein